jgi:hypothetical protein
MDSVIEFITGKVMHTIEEQTLQSIGKKYVDLAIMSYKGKNKDGTFKPGVWRNIRIFEDDYTYKFVSQYIQKGDKVSAVLDVYSSEKDGKNFENYNIIRINKMYLDSNNSENQNNNTSKNDNFDASKYADDSPKEEIKTPEEWDTDPFANIEGDENGSDDNPLKGW